MSLALVLTVLFAVGSVVWPAAAATARASAAASAPR
jgi:hypothetical protein